jgi:hypothetical protein
MANVFRLPSAGLPYDIMDLRNKYRELEEQYNNRLETLTRLSAFARNVGRKQYAQDISEEIRDYKRDFGYECSDRYFVAFDWSVSNSMDDRVHLMREANYDMKQMIMDMSAMILRIKKKLDLKPNENNYRKCKKPKPKVKITKSKKKRSVAK